MNRPLVTAATVLGIGMGGFVDGIVFHQILQAHNMLSAKLPPSTLENIEVNMVWDGLFHALTWLMTALGIGLLWKAGSQPGVPWSGRTLLGGMIFGWGVFNTVEGILDHHLLGLHHVVESLGLSVYDYAFLASGLIFLAAGWTVIRSGASDTTATHPGPANLR